MTTDAIPDEPFVQTPGEARAELFQELAELLTSTGALQFGKFQLPNGKRTPYYLDMAKLAQGVHVYDLGRAFAITLGQIFGSSIDVIASCSPATAAWAVAAAQYYGHLHNPNTRWAIRMTPADGNRFAGGPVGEDVQVVVVDDVLTSGHALHESVKLAREAGAKVVGACAFFDRRERVKGRYAANELARETGVKVLSCIDINQLLEKLPPNTLPEELRVAVVKHVTIGGSV